ncbi:MAG: PEP-CTERM sorting domain-containing protein [Tepidisphaeraceae bacterium]
MHRNNSCRKWVIAAIVASATFNGFSKRAAADTTATWIGASGNWTDPTQWSTNPNYPNNGTPTGTDYQALIDTDGGGPYSVTLNSDTTIDSLTLNNANATLDHTGGTLTAGQIDINAGAYDLNGGTIANATVNLSASGQFQIENGTLNGVTVTGGDLQTVDRYARVIIQNGLTMDNHNLVLGTDASVFFDGSSQTIDNLNMTVGSPGAIAYIYPGGPNYPPQPQTLTLGSHVTVHSGIVFTDNAYPGIDSLINNGTLNADSPLGALWVTTGNFTNNNIAEATKGGTLSIYSANWSNGPTGIVTADNAFVWLGDYNNPIDHWSNAGIIQAINSATLMLGGNVTTADIGNVQVDSTSDIRLDGILTNTSATLSFPHAHGVYLYGTIIGGTIDASAGNVFPGPGTLNGVTVTGGDLHVNYGMLTIQNGISIADHNLDISNGSAACFDGPSQTIDNINITGEGTIYPSGPTSNGPQTLTLGPNVTVRPGPFFSNQFVNYNSGDSLINNGIINADGHGSVTVSIDNFTNNNVANATNGGTLNINSSNFTNNSVANATNGGNLNIDASNWSNGPTGIITADDGSLTLGPWFGFGSQWTNAGVIRVIDQSIVRLGGNFTTADMGNFQVDSTSILDIWGTLNNTSATFVIPRNFILDGTIMGGVIDLSSGSLEPGMSATLNGVTIIGGDLSVDFGPGPLNIQNGITIADHNLDVVFGRVRFDGPSQTIDNLNITDEGTIYPSGPTSNGPQTLTLGPNVTVHAGFTGLQFENYNAGDSLINNGAINADGYNEITILGPPPPSVLSTISVDNFINNGLVQIASGNALTISYTSFINHGTIAVHGGILSLYDDSSGSPITGELDVADGILTGTGTINGNVILSSDPSTLAFQLGDESLTINGNMTLAGNLVVTLANGYLPSSSDIFTVLDVNSLDSLTGSFLNVADGGTLETADGSGYFTVEYADSLYPNEIVLIDFQPGTIPEPASVGVLCAAGAGLLMRRKRIDSKA